MDICVDFDGTCVAHDFPRIGHEIGSASVLRRLVEQEHRIILFTMRSNKKKIEVTENDDNHLNENVVAEDYLDQAVKWFADNDIPLHGINVNPTQKDWTDSPKAYGQLYIDDAALGIPLVSHGDNRPYVNWAEVLKLLQDKGILV